jgi:hypothetical protein
MNLSIGDGPLSGTDVEEAEFTVVIKGMTELGADEGNMIEKSRKEKLGVREIYIRGRRRRASFVLTTKLVS